MSKQLAFEIPTHGGRRKNAGRKKRLKHELAHSARERVTASTPLHITIKLKAHLPGLRTKSCLRAFKRGIQKAALKGLRVQQFAVETNHIHLLAEADENRDLTLGMASLESSIVWALRKIFGYWGEVFRSRFHLHVLRTPSEMKRALSYVLFNHSKHTGQPRFADLFSSIFEFVDLRDLAPELQLIIRPAWRETFVDALTPARAWLQRLGWKRGR